MKEPLNNWLRLNGGQSGVLACGIVYPDKTSFAQSFDTTFPIWSLEQLWQMLSDTLPLLQAQKFRLDRERWFFKNVIVHCRMRKDGACLAILLKRDAPAAQNATVERILSEFEMLDA